MKVGDTVKVQGFGQRSGVPGVLVALHGCGCDKCDESSVTVRTKFGMIWPPARCVSLAEVDT